MMVPQSVKSYKFCLPRFVTLSKRLSFPSGELSLLRTERAINSPKTTVLLYFSS